MAEKRTIEVEIQDNTKTLKQQYKEAVLELQKMAATYGEMSDQAVNAAKKAAELKDQIEDTNDLMKSFKGEGAFIAMNKAMQSVASGFSAVEGGLGLIGVESESIQKQMLKVQSAMALAQGLEGLEDAGRAFKNFGTVAVNALKGLKTAIGATGIGLLVVAAGALFAYWDDIKKAVSGVSDEQTKLNKKTEANLKTAEAKVESLNKQDNILKLQGKTEKEILQLKITELDAAIKIAEVNLNQQKATKKAQVEAAQRNKDILVGIISFMSIPLELLLKSVDKVASFIGKETGLSEWYKGVKDSAANLLFDPAQTASEGDAAIKEAEAKLLDMKNSQAGYKLQIQQIEREAAQKSISNASNTAKELKNIDDELARSKIERMEDGIQKEMELLKLDTKIKKDSYDKDLKDKVLTKKDYDKAITELDATFESKRKNIYEKGTSDRLKTGEFTIQGLIDQKTQEVELENDSYLKKKQIKDKEAKEDADRIEKLNELRIKAVKDSLQIVSDITQLFAGKSERAQRKAFTIQKGINIANATVDTYKAATSALRDYPSPYNYIAMAATITAGLLNIKKISATKFEGGGSGGNNSTSAPSGGNIITPQFNTVGNNGINQLAQLQQTPTRAYVVSGEVTSAQALDRNRVQNSSL